MRLLTATHERQGDQEGDFCFAVEGELVLVGPVCAADSRDPDGGCGCGRAFSGMGSRRATTTALVRDLDLTADQLRLAVEEYWTAYGLGPEVIGPAPFREVVDETVGELVGIAPYLPVGEVVGRRLDHLVHRGAPITR